MIKITNAQKVKKCARPGTDHRSSLRCPNTSTTCAFSRSFSCASRSFAGWPDLISL